MLTQVHNQKAQSYKSENTHNELSSQLNMSKYHQTISIINNDLMDSLLSEIHRQKLKIAQIQIPFKLRQQAQRCDINVKINEEMKLIIQKKQKMMNELKDIQNEEYRLHINQERFNNIVDKSRLSFNESRLYINNLNSSRFNANTSRMFRSQLTEQQKVKIKQVIQNQKKFIKQLKQKQKQYYEQLEQDRKNNIEIQENIKKQKCEERKKYWFKIKQDIIKRQQERKQKFKQDQQRLKDVKKCKKLYQCLQNQDNKNNTINDNKMKEALDSLKKEHKFSLEIINEHQNKYEQTIKGKYTDRQKHFQEFQEKVKTSLPKIPKGKFYMTVMEEEKQKQIEDRQKQRKRLERLEKKNEFSSHVKEYFKPKVSEALKQNLLQTLQQHQIQVRQGLGLKQTINVGNNYMKQVNRNISLQKLTKSKLHQIEQVKKQGYTNYLIDLKRKRKVEQIRDSLTNEVSRIMKNTNYSALQKIERAKVITKRIENKQNHSSLGLLKNINEKMKILQVLSKQ